MQVTLATNALVDVLASRRHRRNRGVELLCTLLQNHRINRVDNLTGAGEHSSAPSFVSTMTVTVFRSKEVVEYRSSLPILGEEHVIVDTITTNLVSFICGETGCGKSTQLPQFLFEMGYGTANAGIIAMTQPRKLAVLNISNRISFEMGALANGIVSHQTRDRSTVNHNTAIKIMTDGILLREIQDDLLLLKYSVVIVDEVHERTSNVDILLVLLSRALFLRNRLYKEGKVKHPLRLVLMSANSSVQDIVQGDLFKSMPVPAVHIEGRAFRVVPHFCRKTPDDYKGEAVKTIRRIHSNLPEGDILVFLPGKSDLLFVKNKLLEDNSPGLDILILHSEVSAEIMSTALAGKTDPFLRRCILSTNIAETSITIPSVVYVIDSGRVKQRRFDPILKAYTYSVEWVSKSSSIQRMGRAGRSQDGHCYRLYSSSVYENFFPQDSEPELLRSPLEGFVLLLKSLGVDKMDAFPLINKPSAMQYENACALLQRISALTKDTLKITNLGVELQTFPIHPCLAKMLIMATNAANLDLNHVVLLVSVLSSQRIMKKYSGGSVLYFSECFSLLNAFITSQHETFDENDILEVNSVKRSLLKILFERYPEAKPHDPPLAFDQGQAKLIRKLFPHCFPDNICKLASPDDLKNRSLTRHKQVAYIRCHDDVLVFLDHKSGFLKSPPQFICYFEAYSIEDVIFIKMVTKIKAASLA